MNAKQIAQTVAPANTLHGSILRGATRGAVESAAVTAVFWGAAAVIAKYIESQSD